MNELVVDGRLDLQSARQLAARVRSLDPDQGVALDLSRVTYIDLHALGTLLAADLRLRGLLVLQDPSECVCEALRLYGMDAAGPMPIAVRTG